MSSLRNFALGLLLSAAAGAFGFAVLMLLGSYESRTGIEKGASPALALLGAVIIGTVSPRIQRWMRDDLPERWWARLPITAAVWGTFLAVGALVVWWSSGGADLGPAGGDWRDFEHYWEAAVAVSGCFVIGLALRWAASGIRRISQIFTR